MPPDFFDPTPEQQNVILIDAATLRKAERMIESCEYCNPDGAEISRAERRNDDPVMISRNIDVLSGYGVPAQAILSKMRASGVCASNSLKRSGPKERMSP